MAGDNWNPFHDIANYIGDVSNLAQNDLYDPLGQAESIIGDRLKDQFSSSTSAATGTTSLTDPKQEKAEAAKWKAQQAQKAAQQRQLAEQKAEIQAVQDSPWTQMGNAILQQYQQQSAAIQPYLSGANIPAAQSGAANQALSSLGLSPGSSAGQWLTSQTQAAQATAAPVAAAMNQEAAAYAAEDGPITSALQSWAQDNAIGVLTAPESPWLTALGSHVTSNLAYSGEIPTADIPFLKESPALTKALESSGGYGGDLAGLTSLTDLTVSPSGKVSVKNPTGFTGTTNSGVVPAPTSAPSG
jgi:hypothetical protein